MFHDLIDVKKMNSKLIRFVYLLMILALFFIFIYFCFLLCDKVINLDQFSPRLTMAN